jgi:hypothetical protein
LCRRTLPSGHEIGDETLVLTLTRFPAGVAGRSAGAQQLTRGTAFPPVLPFISTLHAAGSTMAPVKRIMPLLALATTGTSNEIIDNARLKV